MATIKGGETRNIFEPNYGFEPFEWEYHKDWTLQDYINEHYPNNDVSVFMNLAHHPISTIPRECDRLAVGIDIGYETIAGAIATFLVEYAGMTAAAAKFAAGVVMFVGMTAVSMLVNMLLAPDQRSIDDASSQDQSKAYQWGGLSNTSDQMIPINVTLGEMLVAGNLIGVRTESNNVHTAGYSIRDTAYFLYGLTSNTLSSIEEVYINDIPVSDFDQDDVSIYYTLGTSDQNPINTLTSTSMLTDDTPAPASDGIMFPALSTETIVNQELDNPNHMVDLVPSSSVLIGYERNETAIPALPITHLTSDLSDAETTSFTIYYNTALGDYNTEILALDTPFYLYLVDDYGDYQETGEYILCSGISHFSSVNEDETFTVTINSRPFPTSHSSGIVKCYFLLANPIYKSIYTASDNGSDVWNANSYIPSTSWTTKMSFGAEIEDVEFELTHPQGLYFIYGGTHSGNAAGAKFARWTTYDYHIKQYNSTGTVLIADTLFTAPDSAGNDDSLRAMLAGTQDMPRSFFSWGTYTSARVWSLKFTDIIRAKTDYSSRYSTTSSHIALDSNGYLTKGYRYELSIRIHGHGNSDRDGVLGFYTFDPQGAVETNETDVYGTVLYRFKELNYDEVLSYPYTSLLAVAANATPTMNNSMPKVTAKVRAEVMIGSESNKLTPSIWTKGFSQNPAWIALTMLWNNVWGGNISAQSDSGFISKVDIDTWIEFANHCDSIIPSGALSGELNYIFNGTFDTQTTLLEAVNTVVSVANASIIFNGSRLAVYYETDTLMTQVFSPGNIIEDSMTLEYINIVDTANAITGNFIDRSNNYEKTAMSWIYPNSDPRKATSIELIGVTDEQRALRALQYKLNKTNGIKVQYSFQTLSDGLRAVPGDVIGIENEFIEYGAGGGRIQEVNNSTGVFTLDRIYEEVAGTKYITIRASDGTIYPSVTTNWQITNWDNSGETTLVTVGNTIEMEHIESLDVFLIGVGSEICRKALILDSSINSDFTTTISAAGYVPFSNFDQGMFVLSTTQIKGISKEDFCPRNITLTPDMTNTQIHISWDAPLIAHQTKDDSYFEIYRYSLWRRQGTNTQWDSLGEVSSTTRAFDDEAPLGSVYYYKILPIFNYYGAEATIPMSWCTNFTNSGNSDVATGVDFTFSAYEYLPKPVLSPVTTSVGYKATVSLTNDSLRDFTVFITDPDDWLFKDKREGYGFWMRASTLSDTSWLDTTTRTLLSSVTIGASSITVSTTSGLCIPGLIVINDIDLVYVSGISSGTTLIVPYTHDYEKFSIGTNHSSGVSVKNAHLGLNPVKYYAFSSDINVICATRQITATTVYKYNQLTNSISSADWGDILSVGIEKYRLVQGISNHVLYLESVTKKTLTTRYDIPEVADLVITSSHHDAFGYPVSVYAAMWQYPQSEIKLNDKDEIFFTLKDLPPFDHVWFGLTRMQFPIDLDKVPLYGYTSQVSIEGV